MKESKDAKVDRRNVLRALGAGAGAAVGTVGGRTNAKADSETNEEKRKARYRETDHVRAYYRVNKYPS